MNFPFTAQCVIPERELRNAVGPFIFSFGIKMCLANILSLSLRASN